MNSLKNDISLLTSENKALASRALYRIEYEIRHCKKRGISTSVIQRMLSDAMGKISANNNENSDKQTNSKSNAFLRDSLMYLMDLCKL